MQKIPKYGAVRRADQENEVLVNTTALNKKNELKRLNADIMHFMGNNYPPA